MSLIQFTRAIPNAPIESFWGNGHTLETDPTKQGWRIRPYPGRENLWLMGRPGKPGSMTIRWVGTALDVAFYEEEPKEVAKAIPYALNFKLYEDPVCGVGLGMIRDFEKMMEMYNVAV